MIGKGGVIGNNFLWLIASGCHCRKVAKLFFEKWVKIVPERPTKNTKGLAIPRIGGDLNYKISLVPKVTKFIVYNICYIFFSLLMLSAQKLFWWDKSMFALRKKYFFNGKPKMTKKKWIWKIENLSKWPNIRVWDF